MSALTPQAAEILERAHEVLAAYGMDFTHAQVARSIDTACVLCDERIVVTLARDGQCQWFVVSQACSEAFTVYCRTHICDIEEV